MSHEPHDDQTKKKATDLERKTAIIVITIALTAILVRVRRGIRVGIDPTHDRATPQRDVRKPSEGLDERAHERLHALLKRKQRGQSPELRLPLAIDAVLLLLFLLDLSLSFAEPPCGRAELPPHDRPFTARLALAQDGKRGAHAQDARIGGVYPVYERAAQRARERVAEAPREERINALVVVVVVVVRFCRRRRRCCLRDDGARQWGWRLEWKW